MAALNGGCVGNSTTWVFPTYDPISVHTHTRIALGKLCYLRSLLRGCRKFHLNAGYRKRCEQNEKATHSKAKSLDRTKHLMTNALDLLCMEHMPMRSKPERRREAAAVLPSF